MEQPQPNLLAGNAPNTADCQHMNQVEHTVLLNDSEAAMLKEHPNDWYKPNFTSVIGGAWTRVLCPTCGGVHRFQLNWRVWYVFGPPVAGAVFNLHDGQLTVSKGWLRGELLSFERVDQAN